MRLLFFIVALALGGLSCGENQAPQWYRVTFEVYTDLNPLGGVQLSVNGREAATTNASGMAQILLAGHDGLVVPVTVRCPARTRSQNGPVDVTLRTLRVIDPAAAARGIVQRVQCPPEDRTIGVVVRTDGRPGLSLVWQGREISRTDLAGVAHLSFRLRPGTPLHLTLNTQSRSDLRPQNPTRQFMTPDADEVFVWDQEFHEDPPAVRQPRRRRPRIRRHVGPVRIR